VRAWADGIEANMLAVSRVTAAREIFILCGGLISGRSAVWCRAW
jgi:hypothetical protein